MLNKKSTIKLTTLAASLMAVLSMTSCNKKTSPEFFTLTNNKDLTVTFCNYGASIYSIYYRGTCVTYQPESVEQFTSTNKYSGKVVGRTSGRIDKGQMTIDGKSYQFDINEHEHNTLHGGKDGISQRMYKHSLNTTSDGQQVIFTYTSPDGESGYPGEVEFKITYTVFNNSDKIRLDMLATPKTEDKTPICLTGHTYWRLGGENKDGIRKHELKIPADNIANSRKSDQIIEPGLKSVKGDEDEGWYKNFDFTKFHEIGERIQNVADKDPTALGYDHGWIFNTPNSSEELPNKVELQNKATNMHLTVSTDIDMVFIYANCHKNEGEKMLVYGEDQQYAGVAIEPMVYLNNNPDGSGYTNLLHTHSNPFDKHIEYELNSTIN